jgi:membrane protease YdiL (CAAX protease family)
MENELYLSSTIMLITGILIVVFCNWLIHKNFQLHTLGLEHDILNGLFYGILFTIPMFLGYAFYFHDSFGIDGKIIYRDIVLAGFGEEFIYRGFLFGLFFYSAGWGFIPACLVAGFFFGMGHLYKAETLNEGISVFLFTALASAGFAWFYYVWNSLWMLVFLHASMDLVWDMFNIETDVTGNMVVNIFRFATLGIVIIVTARFAKRTGKDDLKYKLWVN